MKLKAKKQIIVFLDNGLDAFFDSEGNFLELSTHGRKS